jgi:hypothetical protein
VIARQVGATFLLMCCLVGCSSSDAGGAPTALPLTRGGSILHLGTYCPSLQAIGTGEGVLPVANGCQFSLNQPQDLFATDNSHYSVSKVVGEAQMGLKGAPYSRVLVACRLDPRAVYWFWISGDGHWNIDDASDVHKPKPLVPAAQVEAMRPHLKLDALNTVDFKCQGGQPGANTTLAFNANGYQFAAVAAPGLSDALAATPLTQPRLPWFVDIGVRLPTTGTLQATVAKLSLYDSE